ncbi:MAG TPA: hypothetical protein V6D50_21205 [Chroococcales cyanobacterium]
MKNLRRGNTESLILVQRQLIHLSWISCLTPMAEAAIQFGCFLIVSIKATSYQSVARANTIEGSSEWEVKAPIPGCGHKLLVEVDARTQRNFFWTSPTSFDHTPHQIEPARLTITVLCWMRYTLTSLENLSSCRREALILTPLPSKGRG